MQIKYLMQSKKSSLPGLIDKKVLVNHVNVDHKLSSDVNQAICLNQACSAAQQCWLWNNIMNNVSQVWCSHITLLLSRVKLTSNGSRVEYFNLNLLNDLLMADCILHLLATFWQYTCMQQLFTYMICSSQVDTKLTKSAILTLTPVLIK